MISAYSSEVKCKMKDKFLWCLHCETVFINKNNINCPYCNAGILDIWTYKDLRRYRPEYPKNPKQGDFLPLYP